MSAEPVAPSTPSADPPPNASPPPNPPLSAAPSGPAVAARAAELLRRTTAEAERADAKASILLAGTLAVVGGASALVSTVHWNPFSQPVAIQVTWWAALLAIVGGLVALGTAIYPRGHRLAPDRTRLGYFGDVVTFATPAALSLALHAVADDTEDVIDQVWQVSHIVDTKYRLIRLAVRSFLVAVVLLLAVLVAALAAA